MQDADSMKLALQSLPQSHFPAAPGTGNGNGNGTGDNSQIGEISETLKVALAHVHTISHSLTNGSGSSDGTDLNVDTSHGHNNNNHNNSGPLSPNYVIPGGCPFKTQYAKDTTFVDAMEEFSLFGLMGKMIEKTAAHADADAHSTNTATPANTSSNSTGMAQEMGMKRVKSATSLSHALKHGTQESHNAAESVHFVKEFIKGNIDKTLYSILILNLYHLYEELEALLDEHAPIYFNTLHFPKELSRREALRDDVDFYHGEDMLESASSKGEKKGASQATVDYIRRIRYIAEKEPLLLLSHAYTRYLGDLSGGKILARVAKRALNLQDASEGLAFYQFDEIPSAKLFKDEYRRALDELHLTDAQIERLVAEANVAFVLNMRIFEELDVLSGIEGATVRDYESATVYYEDCVVKQMGGTSTIVDDKEGKEEKEQFKCPFAMLGGPNPHKKDDNEKETSNQLEKEQEHLKMENHAATATSTNNHTASETKKRCPWPFVFFHDPQAGMRDYQTWIVIGLLLCYGWTFVEKRINM